MIEITLHNYTEKLQRLTQEIQYIDQQRASRVEEALKVQGAIEALKDLESAETDPVDASE